MMMWRREGKREERLAVSLQPAWVQELRIYMRDK
jgi:hypothetical protein